MNPETSIENLEPDVSTDIESERPEFADIEPDLREIRRKASNRDCENLVVIGNGGSITSFRALYYAFIDQVDKDVYIVNTPEPDLIKRVSRNTRPENTLVMPISKSGETTSVVETLLHFLDQDYPVFAVTSDNEGALRQIIEKKDLEWIEHKQVGGRFSGLTETALMPAAICGIDVEQVRRGGEKIYSSQRASEKALKLSEAIYTAEKNGFDQVLAPFYSTRLFGFYPLMVQLMHETVSKEGEGFTVFGDLGPEYQHHTNQRLFGGPENILPLFVVSSAHEHEKLDVPEELTDIEIRDRKLGELDGEELSGALESEYQGVRKALDEEERPYLVLEVENLDYGAVGGLIAFLQLMAFYSAKIRDVNPYNQPDVEKSKDYGFERRFKV
ncbi:MAG: hypothetical protein ABEK00_02275 [Candidatus Nanohaloarchaea archaeon]